MKVIWVIELMIISYFRQMNLAKAMLLDYL